MNGICDRKMKKYSIHILPVNLFKAHVYEHIDEPYAAIVCSDLEMDDIVLNNRTNILRVTFRDTEQDIPGAFTDEMASDIHSFLKGLPDEVNDLYVCCNQGESRSPALAAAILRITERDEMKVWRNAYYHPNILVYTKLCKQWGINISRGRQRLLKTTSEQTFVDAQKRGNSRHDRWEILD